MQVHLFPLTFCTFLLLPRGRYNLLHPPSISPPACQTCTSWQPGVPPRQLFPPRAWKPYSGRHSLLPGLIRSLHPHLTGWAWRGGEALGKQLHTEEAKPSFRSSPLLQQGCTTVGSPLLPLSFWKRDVLTLQNPNLQHVINCDSQKEIECSARYENNQVCTAPAVPCLQKLCLTPTAASKLSLGFCALATLAEGQVEHSDWRWQGGKDYNLRLYWSKYFCSTTHLCYVFSSHSQ